MHLGRIQLLKSSTVGSCCVSSNSAALCAVAAHPAPQLHYVLMGRIQQLSCIMCCWGASSNSAALCVVGAHPENHHPRWVPPHALLARGSVDGATNLAAPSTQPPSGRPSEQGRRGRCFSTCHLVAHCRRGLLQNVANNRSRITWEMNLDLHHSCWSLP